MNAPRKFRVGSPLDLPNLACAMLDFVPTDSVVVIALGPQFAARMDASEPEGIETILEVALKHRVRGVMVVGFGAEPSHASRAAARLHIAGIEVLDCVTAHENGAITLSDRSVGAYVLDPFWVEHRSRDEYAASLGLDPRDAIVVGTEPKVLS